MIKLHLGCGKRNFGEDWIHIDGEHHSHIESYDITCIPQYRDNTVDLIYASHVIEYFDREEVISVLKEWHRVLKPGGILRLAVPNFYVMANLYMQRNYPLNNFLGPLYGKMKMGETTIYHKTVYDSASLSKLLLENGFNNPREWNWWEVDHGKFDDHSQAYLPHMQKETGALISLNIEATK